MPALMFAALRFLGIAATALLAEKASTAVVAGQNTAVAAAVCHLAAVSTSPFSPTAIDSSGLDAHKKLHALNLTLHNESVLKVFKHKGETAGFQKSPPESLQQTQPWPTQYKYWLSGAKYLEETKQANTDEIKLATAKLSSAQKLWLQRQLQPVLATADTSARELAAAQSVLAADKTTGIKSALGTAVYGQPNPATPALTDAALFGSALDGTRTNFCDEAQDKTKLKTAIAALICICAPNSGGAEPKACFTASPAITNWDAAADSATTKWEEIAKHCQLSGTAQLTAMKLEQALQAVISRMHTDGEHTYLGALTTGSTCIGTSATGMCIRFKNARSAAAATVSGAFWISTITSAIQNLKSEEEAAQTQTSETKTLKTMLQQALALAEAATTVTGPIMPAKRDKDDPNGNTVNAAATCNEAKDNQEACKKLEDKGCVFNDESKICDLKKEAKEPIEKESQEDKDEKKEEKCAKHETNKDKCEKENSCKWDGNKCKNFSFLVNKKFALSVAASFVRLLPF
uniref:Variant surface glycoprotein (VSG), putative n=1 Tax=Trypanosoma brucei TaxID=5691 RepID=Q57WM6_9TRYP|nr:variant surface glycoprotein (VSG), putative [Trypanosoma brucei]